MKHLRYILLFCGVFISLRLSAQIVSNVRFEQDGNKVVVTYQLDEEADVSLRVSLDGGETFSDNLKEVTGDVGKDVKKGSNRIVWNALLEYEEMVENRVQFYVYAQLPQKNMWFNKILAQGYLSAGGEMTKGGMGYNITSSVGVRLRKNAYVGAEAGFHHLFNAMQYSYLGNDFTTDYWYIPVGVNVKAYAPMYYYKHSVFVSVSLGGYLGYGYYYDQEQKATLGTPILIPTYIENHWSKYSGGGYFSAGVGMDLGYFSWNIGYTRLFGEINANIGQLQVGLRLGRYR